MGTVKQTKILFEVRDLIAFRVVCKHCGGEAVHSFKVGFPDALEECPWCNQVWHVGQVNRLIETVRTMLNDPDDLTCLWRELDGETSTQPDREKS